MTLAVTLGVFGNDKVDLHTVEDSLGVHRVRLATEAEFIARFPECEIGAMPPFGPLYGQRVFVDRTLAADPEIVFNAGSHANAIRMRYEDYAMLVQPVVGEFSRHPLTRTARARG